jgi:hypothetical protein
MLNNFLLLLFVLAVSYMAVIGIQGCSVKFDGNGSFSFMEETGPKIVDYFLEDGPEIDTPPVKPLRAEPPFEK